MNGLVKAVRHIQIKKIAYSPKLFQAIITYESHPFEYDESDDIEHQKQIMNKLVRRNWFVDVKSRRRTWGEVCGRDTYF
jgi:hypothetical protein